MLGWFVHVTSAAADYGNLTGTSDTATVPFDRPLKEEIGEEQITLTLYPANKNDHDTSQSDNADETR